MEEKIPNHCIESFVKRFNVYPSIIELTIPLRDVKNSGFLKKSETLWFSGKVNEKNEILAEKELIEYDSTGILFYMEGENKLFILTTIGRQDVSKFTVHKLKQYINTIKTIKDGD